VPKRFCQCRGCPSCNTTSGSHGTLFDADATGTLKCPGCQGVATQKRNARPSSTSRGYDSQYEKNKPVVVQQGRQGRPCWICGKIITPSQKVTVEHKTPLRAGGTNDLDNLAPAHSWCNTGWNRGHRRP